MTAFDPDSLDAAPWPAFRSCGVRIDAMALDAAAQAITSGAAPGAIHLCNAYTLSLASRDRPLADVLDRSALNLADGMPLVWIARRLGITTLPGRVYGPDLMMRCVDVGRSRDAGHFLYGSTTDVLTRLTARLQAAAPGCRIVDAESPPFSDDPAVFDDSLERITSSGADIVWIGLGTPKQDLVAHRFAARAPSVTFVAVGAAFDFLSGTTPQAPRWMQDRGLEWSYRLASEPRRLWRRYLIGNSRFVVENLRRRPVVLGPATSNFDAT